MAGLKHIKGKIVAVKKSQAVTRAMEAVAAAKMRKSQQRALRGRAYARAAAAVLQRLSGALAHPLMQGRPVVRALYIVVTSDKGLAGSLNSGVLRATEAHRAAQGLDLANITVVAQGKKAADYFKKRGVVLEMGESDLLGEVRLSHLLAQRFVAGEFDAVYVAYQNFVSTFEQRPTVRTVFPLSVEELERIVADIVPAKGAYADQVSSSSYQVSNYTVEPSAEEVLGVLLPKLAGIIIYHAMLEAEASEHSARMVAMKSAGDKAGEMQQALTLQFNKARQAAITREVSEIIGGMEAVA